MFKFREGEREPSLLMASFFFAVITVFQVLKPLKKAIFLEHIGAERELIAKNLNILVAAGAMVLFTYLYNQLGGRRLIFLLCAVFVSALLALSFTMSETPPTWLNWSFYLFGDLWSTVWVAVFWAFLNEISTSEQSKRLYGLIGAGGTAGGLVGATLVVGLVRQSPLKTLLLLCTALTILILVLVVRTDQLARRPDASMRYGPSGRPLADWQATKSSAALEGARLVMGSHYLLAVVGIMGLYELCSQIMDFQFSTASESIVGSQATGFFIANVYLITNLVAVAVQIFLTTYVMRRLGLTAALMVLPLTMALSSGIFMAVPMLFFAGMLNVADNGFNYSINQTARETLFVPTSSDEKYKARAFTNMFVQRAGKGLATAIAAIFILIGPRWLSLVTISITGLWIALAIFAGRRFRELSLSHEEKQAKRGQPARVQMELVG